MFFNLAAALNSERRMISLGTGAEYGHRYYQPKMREDYFGTHIPEDAYGFSKYVCAKYIENSNNIINLRLFGVFGMYEDYEFKFISNSIVKNLLNLPIEICQNVYFDYLYIEDLVRIIECFITNEPSAKVYNVTPSDSIDLLTIVNIINRISGTPSAVKVLNEGLNTEYSGDNARLTNELGEKIFTPYEDAIKELYEWYKFNIDKIDRQVIEKDECIKKCRVKK